MPDQVRVVFRKYDGSLHWQMTLRRLGVDEHGIWAGARAGATARRGHEPTLTIEHDHVMLFPPEAGWVARFNAEPHHTEVYCDLTTVPVWPARDKVTMVDLDLDVCRMRSDGSVRLLDEDEFALHRLRYSYPDDFVTRAWRTAVWLQAALGEGTEPFAGGYRRWLAQVR